MAVKMFEVFSKRMLGFLLMSFTRALKDWHVLIGSLKLDGAELVEVGGHEGCCVLHGGSSR